MLLDIAFGCFIAAFAFYTVNFVTGQWLLTSLTGPSPRKRRIGAIVMRVSSYGFIACNLIGAVSYAIHRFS